MQACRQFVTIRTDLTTRPWKLSCCGSKFSGFYRLSRDITLRAEEMGWLASMTFTPHAVAGIWQNGLGFADEYSQRCVNAHRQWQIIVRAQRRENLPSPVIKQALEAKSKLESRPGTQAEEDGKIP